MTYNIPLVIHHGNCLDGFGAAFALYKLGGKYEYLPAQHGDKVPNCTNREVFILDFSYKRPILRELCACAKHVTIIDHHITAKEDLEGLELEFNNLTVVFDMEKSGAVLAWEYFHKQPVPKLLLNIQDRDIWCFNFPESDDVNAGLMSYERTFDFWNELICSTDKMCNLTNDGKAINRYRQQLIESYKEKFTLGKILEYEIPIINCPSMIASDLLGFLAKNYPFAAGYQDRGLVRKWSLRSRNSGIDVAKVAEKFGGGGHRNAAGFITKLPKNTLTIEL
jgi:oligoribonuclease NrnB/cAMP/cGMP phosphodiesterase (DHH superfamily)